MNFFIDEVNTEKYNNNNASPCTAKLNTAKYRMRFVLCGVTCYNGTQGVFTALRVQVAQGYVDGTLKTREIPDHCASTAAFYLQ